MIWTYKTHDELKRHTGHGVGGVLGFVIYLLVSPVTYFVVPSEIRQMYESRGLESPVRGITGLWVLLPILGPFIWFPKVQGALNRYWQMHGATQAPPEGGRASVGRPPRAGRATAGSRLPRSR